MSKYLLAYHGGDDLPATEAEQASVMAAWTDWLGTAGERLVDGGAPIGTRKTVSADGAVSDGGTALNGYSLIEADSIDEAVAFAKASPHLAAGGSVEVGETIEM